MRQVGQGVLAPGCTALRRRPLNPHHLLAGPSSGAVNGPLTGMLHYSKLLLLLPPPLPLDSEAAPTWRSTPFLPPSLKAACMQPQR